MSGKAKLNINCPSCKNAFDMEVNQSLNVQLEPELKQDLVKGLLNVFECPFCDQKVLFHDYFLYHDMEKGIIIHCFNSERKPFYPDLVNLLYENLIKTDLENQSPSKIIFGMDKLVKIIVMLESKIMFNEIQNRFEDAEDKIIYSFIFDMAEEWLTVYKNKDYERMREEAQSPFEKGMEKWHAVQKSVKEIKSLLKQEINKEQKERLKSDFGAQIESLRQALPHFSEAVEKCVDFMEAHRHMAWVYDTIGEPEKGIKHFLKCYELRPNDPCLTACLAQSYLHSKDLNKAMEMLVATCVLAPQDMNTRFNLGLGFKSKGNLKNAVREFEYAEKLADNEKSAEFVRKQIDMISRNLS